MKELQIQPNYQPHIPASLTEKIVIDFSDVQSLDDWEATLTALIREEFYDQIENPFDKRDFDYSTARVVEAAVQYAHWLLRLQKKVYEKADQMGVEIEDDGDED